jgi:hypothetical protein
VALVLAGALAACGVPTQDAAIPIAVENPRPASPGSGVTASAGSARLWFVEDDGLVEVPGASGSPLLGDLLGQLAAGPPEGVPATVRSLLTDPAHGGTLLAADPAQATLAPAGPVTLIATEAFGALPADEQVLLIGQVVLTLCGAGADSVQIVDAKGVPLAVPLPDGRLLDRPAAANDYAALVGPLP